MMRLLLLIVLATGALSACRSNTVPPPTTAAPDPIPAEAVPQRVRAALADPGAVVLDVRTPSEWNDGHVAGARLVDVGDPAFASTIAGLDRSKTYYVYCRSGNRSARAIEQMRAAGFAHLHNVGGYAALVAGGVPSEP